jgi:integrase
MRQEDPVATFRQLPSGNWQAIVYIDGKQVPFTDPSEAIVKGWAEDQEYAKRHGTWRDPRLGRITLDAWHDIWLTGRAVESNTTDREASTWRVWVEPRWGSTALERLEKDRDGIKAWVKDLVDDPDVGAWTILNIVKLLSKMLADAVDSGRVAVNPAVRLRVPSAPKKPPFFWTMDEAGAIIEATRRPYDVLVDFDMHVGPRIGELAGLMVDCVDTRLALVHVVRVAVDGVLREYPKSTKSYRSVPIPPHLLEDFDRLIFRKDAGDPVFTAPAGGMLNDNNFRNRIFAPALASARTCECQDVDETGLWVPCGMEEHTVRGGDPHDMRHTAASWMVMNGIDMLRVQDQLGHEKASTTQRYAHLDPSKHDAVRAVWGAGGLATRRPSQPSQTLPKAPSRT